MNLDDIIAQRKNKTIYRDGNKCIKMFAKDYSKTDVLNEALNQARIEETELNIPKILEVTTFDGCWAIISDFIEGQTLSEMIGYHPEKIKEYIDLMIDLQIKMHEQKCPLLTNLRDKMFSRISLTDFDPETKFELQTNLEKMPRNNKVCHGDFCPSNIIITPQNIPYIIDWAHVTQGNASADVARTYLIYILSGRKENGEYYINKFCEKTNASKEYIEKWVRIIAASLSVKGSKEDLAHLTRIVNMVDYD